MGFFDFVKEAGEKLIEKYSGAEETRRQVEEGLKNRVNEMGLNVEDISAQYHDGIATITGKAASQEEREKVVLLVGNTRGIGRVDDQLTVEDTTPESELHTVKSGDTLSKIAKQYYGNAGKYMVIFEANKPMLKDPNKIYPGQVLRIPPKKS
ncbi:MAG: peptidoglycan-binding protein LysM [Deltaproteobacteria bacterium]|nr:peptidoglycan-binding protein LysM [Deltaproteobacteria bacterium]